MFSRKPGKGEGPWLVVQAMIRKNTGEYLAIKRAGRPEQGAWEFPGGRVEPGEKIEKALEREIREETNLKVDIERFVGWGQGGTNKTETGEYIDRFVMFFECKLIKGNLTLDHTIDDHNWATLEEIMQFKPLSRPVQDFFSKFRLVPKELLTPKPKIFKTEK
jgi:8-oxo-dGTP diphosphatase